MPHFEYIKRILSIRSPMKPTTIHKLYVPPRIRPAYRHVLERIRTPTIRANNPQVYLQIIQMPTQPY